MLQVKSKEAGNAILRNGLVLDGRRCFVRKSVPEPPRCLKCQSFKGNHRAATCPSSVDVCAKCGGPHRTRECEVTRPEDKFCINCSVAGHAASDRACPTFIALREKHQVRNLEARYRYFPTEDPLTWELVDTPPSQPHAPSQAPAPRPSAPSAKGQNRPAAKPQQPTRPRDNGWPTRRRNSGTQGGGDLPSLWSAQAQLQPPKTLRDASL
ncbi:hypothetical protein CONPUDRAFT_109952, partial [Coniophora puteana RWD-64-598 SS2]